MTFAKTGKAMNICIFLKINVIGEGVQYLPVYAGCVLDLG